MIPHLGYELLKTDLRIEDNRHVPVQRCFYARPKSVEEQYQRLTGN